MNPRHRLMTYYGYAFESYCTMDHPPSAGVAAPAWCGRVDTHVQWCSVVKTKISDMRIILGAEVDCVRGTSMCSPAPRCGPEGHSGSFTGQPNTFVELKTTQVLRRGNEVDRERFRAKLLKFWAQSFLLGIPEIVVGYRTHQGRIATYESLQTLGLPAMVQGYPNAWQPAMCLDFVSRYVCHKVTRKARMATG